MASAELETSRSTRPVQTQPVNIQHDKWHGSAAGPDQSLTSKRLAEEASRQAVSDSLSQETHCL